MKRKAVSSGEISQMHSSTKELGSAVAGPVWLWISSLKVGTKQFFIAFTSNTTSAASR